MNAVERILQDDLNLLVDRLAAVTAEHYAGGHWLGSFATYLITRRGIAK